MGPLHFPMLRFRGPRGGHSPSRGRKQLDTTGSRYETTHWKY